MAKNSTQMSRQAGKASATDSTIAGLATKASTASATAVRAAALKTGNNFTGQYLYDRFIGDSNKASVSMMDVVRQMVAALDVNKFKEILGDFVSVAKGYRDNAITAAKEAGGYDEKNPSVAVASTKANYKTAQNQQTVMRIAYGAIKFANDELEKLGGSATTGFHLIRELGLKALSNKGLNWDGTKAETPEARAARAARKAEAEALLKVQEAHPQRDGEARAEYFTRIDKLVDKQLKEQAAEAHDAQVTDLAKRVLKLAKDSKVDIEELLDTLLTARGVDGLATKEATADAALH